MLAAVSALIALGCGDRAPSANGRDVVLLGGQNRADEHPVMVNRELPFRYPGAMYERRVQGNVILRLYIDTTGRALPESTRVEESSGFPALDSSAVRGSQELQFVPAKLAGAPIGVSVLFPVYFRHPEAEPLPGDSILRAPAADSIRSDP